MGTVKWRDIFHSSSFALRDVVYDRVPDFIEQGYVKIKRIVLDVNIVEPMPIFVNAGGGKQHQELMVIAANYLISIGHRPEYEMLRSGKKVDVCSLDGRWRIECGDTDGNVMVDHFGDGCDYYCVIPFPSRESATYMYIFERGLNWSSYRQPIANAGVHLGYYYYVQPSPRKLINWIPWHNRRKCQFTG